MGTGVPGALNLVGYDAASLNSMGWGGKPDEFWLAKAGQLDWLILSCNKKMLKVTAEKETIIRERVGIVFLTSGEEAPSTVLMRLLRKWSDLELLWKTTPRPFARFLFANNHLADTFRDFRL